jgi:hypothetical protein
VPPMRGERERGERGSGGLPGLTRVGFRTWVVHMVRVIFWQALMTMREIIGV